MFRLLKLAVLSAVLGCFPAIVLIFGLPHSSQNFSQFLTNLVCARPDLDFCDTTTSKVRLPIEVPGGFLLASSESQRIPVVDAKLVPIGSQNPDNVLRVNSQVRIDSEDAPYFRLLGTLLSGDLVLSLWRVTLAKVVLLGVSTLLVLAYLPKSHRTPYLLAGSFIVVVGDFLANLISIAPIGLATSSMFSAAAILVSTSQQTVVKEMRIGRLLYGSLLVAFFGFLTSITRVDQAMVLIAFVIFLEGMNCLKLLRVDTERRFSRKFLVTQIVLVIPLLLVFVYMGQFRQYRSLSLVSLVENGFVEDDVHSVRSPSQESGLAPERIQSTTSAVWEILAMPYYFINDLWTSWIERSSVVFQFLFLLYLATIALLTVLIVWAMFRLRVYGALLYILCLGLYVCTYGVLIGPRAELRYVMPGICCGILWTLVSVPQDNRFRHSLERALGLAVAAGLSINLLSISIHLNSLGRLWFTETFSINIAIPALVGISSGVSILIVVLRWSRRSRILTVNTPLDDLM